MILLILWPMYIQLTNLLYNSTYYSKLNVMYRRSNYDGQFNSVETLTVDRKVNFYIKIIPF